MRERERERERKEREKKIKDFEQILNLNLLFPRL